MILTLWMSLVALITMAYCALMLNYWWNWRRYPETKFKETLFTTKVSVIIPARNEANNILNILSDLKDQYYPANLLEIIVVDDSSTDNTAELVQKASFIKVQLLALNTFFDNNGNVLKLKKKAVETAVNIAKGDLIMVTDADCRLPSNWIAQFVAAYQHKKPALIAGPVLFDPANSLFDKFQALDFIGMMAITVAYINKGVYNMCNGSNLAFEKEAFLAVDGYKGIDHVASGDDMLLIYKIEKRFPGKIAYLKNKAAAVKTAPEQSLSAFLQQRFRWTSKSGQYQNKIITRDLALVYFFNWILLISVFLFIFGYREVLVVLIPQIFLKVICDFLLLSSASRFYKKNNLIDVFIPSQFLHLFYILFVGTLGNIMPYTWKGRKLKK